MCRYIKCYSSRHINKRKIDKLILGPKTRAFYVRVLLILLSTYAYFRCFCVLNIYIHFKSCFFFLHLKCAEVTWGKLLSFICILPNFSLLPDRRGATATPLRAYHSQRKQYHKHATTTKQYLAVNLTNRTGMQLEITTHILMSWNSSAFICKINSSRAMRKCALCHMRTTKAQISLRIRAVWSAPLWFAA